MHEDIQFCGAFLGHTPHRASVDPGNCITLSPTLDSAADTALHKYVRSPTPSTFFLKIPQTSYPQAFPIFYLHSSQTYILHFLPQDQSDFPINSSREILLLITPVTATMPASSSSNSSNITFLDLGSTDKAPTCHGNADDSQKADGAEPGKTAAEKAASVKPVPEKSGPPKPAAVQPVSKKSTSQRPAPGLLDGFLHAPWGWGAAPLVDAATVEAARDFQQRQKEKREEKKCKSNLQVCRRSYSC